MARCPRPRTSQCEGVALGLVDEEELAHLPFDASGICSAVSIFAQISFKNIRVGKG
ncbi:MAG TPA: hypothetical protein VK694_03445 [Verrucomicrobiae bacterium]|nr:hypothetical protein [Verrucomicrobiae bacterium]